MRLDFSTFVITGPSTTTTTTTYSILNGQIAAAGGNGATHATRCLTDTFSVSPAADYNPTICGTNTGEHMYIESDSECTNLNFALSDNAIETTLATRSWSIKVTQIACDSQAKAPDGCTQYYTGSTTNTVNSYNYQSGSGYQLANQQQTICVRRERGYCKICWSETAAGDLAVSGGSKSIGYIVKSQMKSTECCGYAKSGTGKLGNYDCIMIPGALNTASACNGPATACGSGFCGNALVTVNGKGTVAGERKTICSTQMPFRLNYQTDNFEAKSEAPASPTAVTDYGFKLAYILTSC